jgi:hypothetical protein
LLTASLVRLHRNAGHATYSNMKTCLTKAGLWDESTHREDLESVLRESACNLAQKPRPPPRVSLSTTERGAELCIDILYFEGIPHLHVEDKYTTFSAYSSLNDRSMFEQIRALSAKCMEPYANPKRIIADEEYDKKEFRAFCEKIGCKLVIITTEAHHQNGTIEAGNRIFRMFFRRIRISENSSASLKLSKVPCVWKKLLYRVQRSIIL